MIHILIPACSKEEYFLNGYWPKNVTEIAGKPMIQYVVENFTGIEDKQYIFLFRQREVDRFHTDDMARILAGPDAVTIRLGGETGGALCTALMAIPYIDNDDELLISNNDHQFDCDLREILNAFREEKADCALVTFDCIHPRWSYVRTEGGCVVETAEKRPISRDAIAGLYYFRKGSDFVEAAKSAIRKGRDYEGSFYLSAAVNEMILRGKKVTRVGIAAADYHTFYDPKQIERFEQEVRG